MKKPTLREQVDTYYQKLLILQFEASDDIKHNPTKGSMREEFIKGLIEGNFPDIKLGRGILTKNNWQSTQIDFFKLKPNARINCIGGQNITELDDCLLFMEIKTDATSKEFKELETVSTKIKELNPNIVCGIFCYNISLAPQTILKRFGFTYQKPPLDFYVLSGDEVEYPHIDFVFTLEAKKADQLPYLIVKDISGEYTVLKNNPVIKDFLNLFKDL